jgi:hypothetical protein
MGTAIWAVGQQFQPFGAAVWTAPVVQSKRRGSFWDAGARSYCACRPLVEPWEWPTPTTT